MQKLLFILLSMVVFNAAAQSTYKPKNRYLEAGFLFGLTNYSGDVTEKPVYLKESHLGYGAYARYHFSNHFALKAHACSGAISGDDANAKDPNIRARSLRFATDIVEVGMVSEWYFIGKDRFSNIGEHNFFITPYVYLGVGGTFSGAKVEYYGPPEDRDKYIVAPLPENGLRQRFLIAPVGAGIRVDLNEVIVLGAEGGLRPVFSDDLDGVRLNGNPKSNDWYYFGGVTISFVFGQSKRYR